MPEYNWLLKNLEFLHTHSDLKFMNEGGDYYGRFVEGSLLENYKENR